MNTNARSTPATRTALPEKGRRHPVFGTSEWSCLSRAGAGCGLYLLAALLAAPLAISAESGSGRFRVTTGVEYSTGDYGGSQSIDEWYVPLTAKYLTGPWVLRLTVPYIEVKAPTGTVVTGGGGGEVVVPGSGPRKTEEGLGDIIAGATYRDVLKTERSADLAVDLTGKVKFGTADEDKGLGTGENDYTVQTDVYKFIDRFTPYATLGYRFRGDPPGANLDNGWLFTLGTLYEVSERLGWSLDYYFREASTDGSDDPQELTAALDYRFNESHKLQTYAFKGLSDGSPDWGLGLMVTFYR